jgi:ribosomal protein S18 acetylase RimI-like enzyme
LAEIGSREAEGALNPFGQLDYEWAMSIHERAQKHKNSAAWRFFTDAEALEKTSPLAICALTRRATDATFRGPALSPEQIASIERNIVTSGSICAAAAASADQRFVAAFIHDDLAGFVVATQHAARGLELDWLMVDPAFHGSGIADDLMEAGLKWLGKDNPIWLGVIRYNGRAIGFYRRFGFQIDPNALTHHAIPHWVMRRPADLPADA